MHTNIRKWGNSLGLRIPRAFAEQLGLDDGSTIDLVLEDGRLVVHPVHPRQLALESLLDGMPDDQLHGEQLTDPARGDEVW